MFLMDGETRTRSELQEDIGCGLELGCRYVCEWLSEDRQASLWLGEGDTQEEARKMARCVWAQDAPGEEMTGTLICHRLVDHPDDLGRPWSSNAALNNPNVVSQHPNHQEG